MARRAVSNVSRKGIVKGLLHTAGELVINVLFIILFILMVIIILYIL